MVASNRRALTIDPIKLVSSAVLPQNIKNQRLLFRLLMGEFPNKYLFEKNVIYTLIEKSTLDQEETAVDIKLTQTIVKYVNPHDINKISLDVIGDAEGKGSYGEVFKATHTLIPVLDQSCFYLKSFVHPRHAIKKIIFWSTTDYPEGVLVNMTLYQDDRVLKKFLREHNFLNLLGFRPKPLIIAKTEDCRYEVILIFTFIVNGTFEKLLASRSTIPTDTLLREIINLLLATQKMHDRNIVHRDIKPTNVMNPENPAIVDFGLAKYTTEYDGGSNVGNQLYGSPEALNGEARSPATDIDSIAKIIAEMLGDELRASYLDEFNWEMVMASIPIYGDLFKYAAFDLSDMHKRLIRDLLSEMTRYPKRSTRTAYDYANAFETILFERRMAERQDESVRLAHYLALGLREFFRDQEYAHIKMSYPLSYESFNLIYDQLVHDLLFFDDEPNAIMEFTDILRIDAFKQSKTKTDIIKKCYDIFTDYLLAVEKLQALERELVSLTNHLQYGVSARAFIKSCRDKIKAVNDRHREYAFTIDNIVILISKLNKEYSKINGNYQSFLTSQLTSTFEGSGKLSDVGLFSTLMPSMRVQRIVNDYHCPRYP